MYQHLHPIYHDPFLTGPQTPHWRTEGIQHLLERRKGLLALRHRLNRRVPYSNHRTYRGKPAPPPPKDPFFWKKRGPVKVEDIEDLPDYLTEEPRETFARPTRVEIPVEELAWV